ncbi:DUF2125 domain-containing protein [Bartonella senegalensis]|uniref:DUF2125 domain-containing protein n=1 Tax=Bartonella senegalensis TaxID=1468418 RepID=UPI00031C9761|nr:DUF2125 domain-containing protein [Bartonella senegalensis]
MSAVCKHIRKNGYPLRIGVVCDQFQFVWPLYGFSLSTPHLTVSAPIYVPHWLEIEVHSPTSIVLFEKNPIMSRWRNLVIGTDPYLRSGKTFKLMAEGLEIFPMASSLKNQKFDEAPQSQTADKNIMQEAIENQASLRDADDIIVHPLEQKNASPKVTAEFVRLDLKYEKNNLSGHITFDDFDASVFIKPEFIDFPKIDGNLKWILNDVSNLFDANGKGSWKHRLYGKSGLLKHAELMFHTGGALGISGPFSFDDEGYLTAEFELAFIQHTELLTTMQRLFPVHANNLQAVFFVLGAMPKNADGNPVLPLLISHGWAKLGFLKLGRLAPL